MFGCILGVVVSERMPIFIGLRIPNLAESPSTSSSFHLLAADVTGKEHKGLALRKGASPTEASALRINWIRALDGQIELRLTSGITACRPHTPVTAGCDMEQSPGPYINIAFGNVFDHCLRNTPV
ncbi:hypothetical protein MesoLjLa_50090 [Mesorhizobium sp. L-2-11]|nr:hypothetical protein MesoLjLa_50090 [Mesorhizobium sp. L-2-11]